MHFKYTVEYFCYTDNDIRDLCTQEKKDQSQNRFCYKVATKSTSRNFQIGDNKHNYTWECLLITIHKNQFVDYRGIIPLHSGIIP